MPGLIILIIAGFYVFLVLPRMGPMVLGVISLIALIAAGVHHYAMFYTEYKLSTWQYALAAYTPWVVLGFALIAMISAILFMFSSPETKAKVMNTVSTPMEAIQEAVGNSYAAMPSASSATNLVTSSINTAMRNNTKSPSLPGLGYSASSV